MNSEPAVRGIDIRFLFGNRVFVALAVLTVIATAACSSPLMAQELERYRPRAPIGGVRIPALPAGSMQADVGSDEVLVDELKGILFLDDADRFQDLIAGFEGIRLDPAADLDVARQPRFEQLITPLLGQPLSMRLLNDMSRTIVQFYRGAGYPAVDVVVPAGQDITDGVVQVVITEVKLGRVRFRSHDPDQACRLTAQSQLQPGQLLFVPTLHEELVWFNQHPFRDVSLSLQTAADAGTSDAVFAVHQRRPWQAFAGYADNGPRLTSRERIFTGLTVGELFGSDGLFSYQWTQDAEFQGQIGVHSVAWEAPLPNSRNSISLLGTWMDLETAAFTGGAISDAHAWQISGRYNHTLHQSAGQRDLLVFGFDVKGTESDLDFGGTTVLNSEVQVLQFMAGISSQQNYCDGHTLYGADLFLSPGGLLGGNSDSDFGQLRAGARSVYAYSRGYLEQLFRITPSSDVLLRATGQLSSYKLLPTEQLGFGGYNSIRGYDMRTANGDSGYFINAELRSHPLRRCVCNRPSELTVLAFSDFGQCVNWNENTNGVAPERHDFLASVGVGLRYVIDPTVTFRFDYGVPLTSADGALPGTAPDHGRIHLGAVLTW